MGFPPCFWVDTHILVDCIKHHDFRNSATRQLGFRNDAACAAAAMERGYVWLGIYIVLI